ncbi:YiiX/YebB-like N1pC/P60 family cysteine hydrolase [Bradyrhizobium sp. WBOS04]|uniref:YiiX/YebB-like N1pC/P60 family cysteine hydrolase n=2 Tax=unclassified Bradyrhizobium TaxID=2631580 RepID=UPI00211F3A21|nr:YiiX/YebB-like N1pC/P60 family cysteine hydrolase [Bradyrhizobium sp. WBOS04]
MCGKASRCRTCVTPSRGLSAAIDDATGKQGAPSFDHVALVASTPKGWEVLHADEKGSRRQSLVEFRQEARAKQRQIVVYRLHAPQQAAIKDAVATARTMLGKPYNTSYVLNEDSYYCSDFIERAFRAHHVFALQPMNFRNPQTVEIAQHWVDLYHVESAERLASLGQVIQMIREFSDFQ